MPSPLVPAFLLAAAVAVACGQLSRASEPGAHHRAKNEPDVASMLDVHVKGRVEFALRVTNNAKKKLELVFPSGKTHDIAVLDPGGREVWRWSEGRIFTQSIQNRLIATDDTLSYEASWAPADRHGTFVAVASLESENHPIEQRVQFTLP